MFAIAETETHKLTQTQTHTLGYDSDGRTFKVCLNVLSNITLTHNNRIAK